MNKNQTAHLMARGAATIQDLRRANQSLGERMELVYDLIEMSKGPSRPPRHIGCEEDVGPLLEKEAHALQAEHEQEREKAQTSDGRHAPMNFPGPAFGDRTPKGADEFLAEMKQLAKDVEISADSALAAKDAGTRKAFVFTTFNRLQALQNRLAGLDLRGPE